MVKGKKHRRGQMPRDHTWVTTEKRMENWVVPSWEPRAGFVQQVQFENMGSKKLRELIRKFKCLHW